ncbi:MAG: dethiobiotin synthase [Nevskiaceae bacterium]|nr:MAG: dethiobiotin synthase [Nevskiaceae bacterium]TBR73150.1 MAG: dethiobiotin synthase [Nevskiaceae bacterium]
MAVTVFVTGTDTGVGKTRVACTVVRAARAHGLRVAPFKPVASGSRQTAEGLRNEDAEALLDAADGGFAYAEVNPFAFEPAIAPHIAARECGRPIDVPRLDAAHAALAEQADLVVVEGAGGWRVPLTSEVTFADWVERYRWPVLLVVGMRLGGINHAVLSADSIRSRTKLAGWAANRLPPPMERMDANLATLLRMIAEPCLLEIGPGESSAAAAARCDWPALCAALGV